MSLVWHRLSTASDTIRARVSFSRADGDTAYGPRSTIFAFISSAIFLLKVIRLLPSIDQRDAILHEISVVIDILHTLRDRGQGAFLREMFDHLQSRLKSHPATRAPSPAAALFGQQLAPVAEVPFDIWLNSMPQMEQEQSLDPNALWTLFTEPEHQHPEHHHPQVDPFDWSIHLNSL